MARETQSPAPDDWLDDDFDPARSTVAYLRGVFLQNNISAPANVKKAELVALFRKQVTPRIPQVRAARQVSGSSKGIKDLREAASESESSSESDDMDVDEFKPGRKAGRGKASASKGKAPVRRARITRSRSASVMSSDEDEPPRKQLKRPRTTSAAKSARRQEPVPEPEPIEEEDEMDVDEPVKQPSPKRSSPKQPSPQRQSVTISEPGDKPSRASLDGRRRSSGAHRSSDDVESGFSDFNPFQESERKKQRRSSAGLPAPLPQDDEGQPTTPARRLSPGTSYKPSPFSQAGASRRKSMPAAIREDTFEFDLPDPPATAERPNKPRMTMPTPGRSGMSSSVSMPAFNNYMVPIEQLKAPVEKYREIVKRSEAQSRSPSASSSPPVQKQKAVESRRKSFNNQPVPQPLPKGQNALVKRGSRSTPTWQLGLLTFLMSLLVATGQMWRQQRFEIGYCPSNVDSPLDLVSTHRDHAVELASCIPCPTHGTCQRGELQVCHEGYVRRPSVFSFNGLLPIGDDCDPDTAMQKRRAAHEEGIKKVLRGHRGLVECGLKPPTLSKRRNVATDVDKYGLTQEDVLAKVKSLFADKLEQSDSETLFDLDFDATFNSLRHTFLQGSHDEKTYFAAAEGDQPLACRVRQSTWRLLVNNSGSLSLLLALLGGYKYGQNTLRSSKEEKEQVNALVDVALDRLQQQMTWNYRDPILTPFARMASAQLRDDVLSHEHSDKHRVRLWKKVEKVILKNANIRRLEAEFHGEPATCWEWIGSPLLIEGGDGEGRASRRQSGRPRVSFAGGPPQSDSLYPQLQ